MGPFSSAEANSLPEAHGPLAHCPPAPPPPGGPGVDLFFRSGRPQSYGPTAEVHRAMGNANFQKTQNGPRFRKG